MHLFVEPIPLTNGAADLFLHSQQTPSRPPWFIQPFDGWLVIDITEMIGAILRNLIRGYKSLLVTTFLAINWSLIELN